MSRYSDWLNNEFLKWEKKTGTKRQPYTAFARFLGVSQPTLNRWLNGDTQPTYQNVVYLAQKLGDEIYSVTGFDPPKMVSPKEFLGSMSVDERARFIKAASEIAKRASSSQIDVNSPEGAALINKVLREFEL